MFFFFRKKNIAGLYSLNYLDPLVFCTWKINVQPYIKKISLWNLMRLILPGSFGSYFIEVQELLSKHHPCDLGMNCSIHMMLCSWRIEHQEKWLCILLKIIKQNYFCYSIFNLDDSVFLVVVFLCSRKAYTSGILVHPLSGEWGKFPWYFLFT